MSSLALTIAQLKTQIMRNELIVMDVEKNIADLKAVVAELERIKEHLPNYLVRDTPSTT